MILVVEALTHDFVHRFWAFVKEAGYTDRFVGEKGEETKHQYYRFQRPIKSDYPAQIELFSRSLGMIDLPEDAHVTPIPTGYDLSSLSAILLDDDYYHYTISRSVVIDGVHVANIESLIALKCKAYLEMTLAKNGGQEIDSKHIKKHRNDIFRLVAAAPQNVKYDIPQTLLNDINLFCQNVKESLPDANLIKDMGLRRITPQQIFDRLQELFLAK